MENPIKRDDLGVLPFFGNAHMEPTNHPFRKEKDLPNLQGIMFHVDLKIGVNHDSFHEIVVAHDFLDHFQCQCNIEKKRRNSIEQ